VPIISRHDRARAVAPGNVGGFAARLWLRGEPKASVSFEEVGADLIHYPFLQIFPQDEHERLLVATLAGLGVSVERSPELLGYSDESGRVIARLRGPDGQDEQRPEPCGRVQPRYQPTQAGDGAQACAHVTASAREVVPGSSVLSMMRILAQSFVNHKARTKPVGPAPTIRTSLRVMIILPMSSKVPAWPANGIS
jgi:hypothetical protein